MHPIRALESLDSLTHSTTPPDTRTPEAIIAELTDLLRTMELQDRRDPHVEKASELFGVPYGAVTHRQREYAKKLTFMSRYCGTL